MLLVFFTHNVTLADYQSTLTAAVTTGGDASLSLNITSTAISPPVELTHLFMNKDGTLDGSRLFNNAQQFFPKVTSGGGVKIFATKNKTKVLAHVGSTVVLPCTVAEESKFEMVSFLIHKSHY